MNVATQLPANQGTVSQLKGHMGRLLLMAAETYRTLPAVLLEVIQNCVDAQAKHIFVKINLQQRTATIVDDGEGASLAKFETALASVGMTIKTEDKYGRFGRGLISPLAICECFTFASMSLEKARGIYWEWTFVTKDIAGQEDNVVVPRQVRYGLAYNPKSTKDPFANERQVPWKTRVDLTGITKDSVLSRVNLDDLSAQIANRYGQEIFKRNIRINLVFVDAGGQKRQQEVEVKSFHGTKLPAFTAQGSDCGTASFELYLSPSLAKGRSGKVLFQVKGNPYRLSVRQFAASVAELQLGDAADSKAIDALSSGVFEGVITVEKIQLHPNRRSFRPNDALFDFVVCLSEWYDHVGQEYFEREREQSKARRNQALGLNAMRVIDSLIQKDETLKSLFDSLQYGFTGIGHVDQPGTISSSRAKSVGGIHGPRTGGTRKSVPPQNEHVKHTPVTVGGPEGKYRKRVSGSHGLQLEVSELPGNPEPFEVDWEIGVIQVNTRHPYWDDCDTSDARATRYIVTVNSLVLGLLPLYKSQLYPVCLENTKRTLSHLVFCINRGDAITGHAPGRKPAKVLNKLGKKPAKQKR